MEIEPNQQDMGKVLAMLLGMILIAGGSWLGYNVFMEAHAIIKEPKTLIKWLALKKEITGSPEIKKAKEPESEKTRASRKKKDKSDPSGTPNNLPVEAREAASLEKIARRPQGLDFLSGHYLIALSFLFLWIMAKIAIGMLSKGVKLFATRSDI